MFGRDALTNLKHLISPKLRYNGDGGVDSGPRDNVKHLPVTEFTTSSWPDNVS